MVETRSYPPVGKCIYCGSNGGHAGLSKEHIVPYALHGQSVLPKASCLACATITGAFEGRCANANYAAFRARNNVQSRRKRKTSIKAFINRGSEIEEVQLPVTAALALMPQFHFLPPGIIRNPQVKEVGWTGMTLTIKEQWSEKPIDFEALGSDRLEFRQLFEVDSYALTLAKIAHCISVAALGVDSFDHWLTPIILGHDKNASYLIGGIDGSTEPEEILHNIDWSVGPWRLGDGRSVNLVTVKIRLFSQLGGPFALVIAGELSSNGYKVVDELQRSQS